MDNKKAIILELSVDKDNIYFRGVYQKRLLKLLMS